MLFGPRLSSLFTSRWMALLWAVLVLLTAIQIVGAGDGGGDGAGAGVSGADAPMTDGLTNDQRATLANAL